LYIQDNKIELKYLFVDESTYTKKIKMFQTLFNAVLLCGVGYALYKKVIQMLKDIDEKYEGKLKTLVFEMEVNHNESIQMLKDINEKNEDKLKITINELTIQLSDMKVKHQVSINQLKDINEKNEDKLKITINELTIQLSDMKVKHSETSIVYKNIKDSDGVYEGTVLNNNNKFIKHGQGKMIYSNGEIYSGCWDNNKMHGKGKLLEPNILTIGCWKNGILDGKYSIYNLTSEPIIRNASTQEIKNGKMWRIVSYRGSNCGQNPVYEGSIEYCNTFDDNGNCSSNRSPYPGGNVSIPGESLNLSPEHLYL